MLLTPEIWPDVFSISRRRMETTRGKSSSAAGKKDLTAAGQVNSELSVKTFNRSLVPSECRQQKSMAVLCEAKHRPPRSSPQPANESHGADRSHILEGRDTLQRPALICVEQNCPLISCVRRSEAQMATWLWPADEGQKRRHLFGHRGCVVHISSGTIYNLTDCKRKPIRNPVLPGIKALK